MSLIVITGGARSGKSAAAQRLVASRYAEAIVVVAAHGPDDHEMMRRVARHRADRPGGLPHARGARGHAVDGRGARGRVPAARLPRHARRADGGRGVRRCAGETARSRRPRRRGDRGGRRGGGRRARRRGSSRARPTPSSSRTRSAAASCPRTPTRGSSATSSAERTAGSSDAADAAYLAVAGRLLDLTALPRDAAWPGEDVTMTAEERVTRSSPRAIAPTDPAWQRARVGAARLADEAAAQPRAARGRSRPRWRPCSGTERPAVARKAIVLMAGDHGVVAQGVSPYPAGGHRADGRELRRGRRGDLAARGVGGRGARASSTSASRRTCPTLPGRAASARSAHGTADMTLGPGDDARAGGRGAARRARDSRDAAAATACTLIGTGEMGIGNTHGGGRARRRVLRVRPGGGRRPGHRPRRRGRRAQGRGRRARARGQRARTRRDPLDVLAAVGGLEIAGLAGVVLGRGRSGRVRRRRRLHRRCRRARGAAHRAGARDYLFASHRSAEPGHARVLDALGLQPVLELDMRLGRGDRRRARDGGHRRGVPRDERDGTFAEAGVSEARRVTSRVRCATSRSRSGS